MPTQHFIIALAVCAAFFLLVAIARGYSSSHPLTLQHSQRVASLLIAVAAYFYLGLGCDSKLPVNLNFLARHSINSSKMSAPAEELVPLLSSLALASDSASTSPPPSPHSSSRKGVITSVAGVTDPVELAAQSDNQALQHRTAAGTTTRRGLDFLSPAQVTGILSEHASACAVERGKGVVRYDITQVACNEPMEDDHSEALIRAPCFPGLAEEGDWMFWGIYDGHCGWPTAAKLRQSLIHYVCAQLTQTYEGWYTSDHPSDTTASQPVPSIPRRNVAEAIEKAFVALDNDIVQSLVDLKERTPGVSRQEATQLLAPAVSGSCALLGFYDTRTEVLFVACTGDSRAVLGRRNALGKWSTVPLSVDQTFANLTEAVRVKREHPYEGNVIAGAAPGRLLGGLEPSRSFGDAVYKWPRKTSAALNSLFAEKPRPHVRTPPYTTAKPVVTSGKISPKDGDFVVMGCDGLWEMLTNEEVVGLVSAWIDAGGLRTGDKEVDFSAGSGTGGTIDLPKQMPKGLFTKPIRPEQWGVDLEARQFVLEDNNAAVHLAKNAMGANDADLAGSLLMLPEKQARRFRDDLTITVIFFGP
ncbi:phosphatase 2C-like domain-containing protein [Podospora didyma]|uniref:Phosphatase 2C-like domain-containing protein n=1 Tax=Podospora didyma TaxID=330526 RepID=A0AAE0N6L3_9PEZI|nr:phosphatase 2C-like domain-containing protein [Podospora didyma]